MFVVGTTLLVLGRKIYVDRPPSGTVVVDAFRVITMMAKRRSMDAPKPSYITERGQTSTVRWDDQFVEEVKRTLQACKVFLVYPIFWMCYSQFSTNFVTQAMQMRGHGIPNDLMQNFDPIAIIVFIPILDYGVYPLLRKFNIRFRPISRIVFGFWVMSLAMAYAAILQHYIYLAPPCYDNPLCGIAMKDGKKLGNDIHIAIQAPAYVLIGVGEIFASATGYEYAYTKAPPRMKAFVQSLFLLTTAFGSALALAFLPALFNPAFMYVYTGLAAGCFLAGCVIWVLFRKLNELEDDMNFIEGDVDAGQQLNTDSEQNTDDTEANTAREGVEAKN
jgi:POT family proton-dependent oligopeptide transporter